MNSKMRNTPMQKGWVRMRPRPNRNPPGEFIRRELAARGWTQAEFAKVIGRPLQTVNQIIKGRKRIIPETAVAIGSALGDSAELWLKLVSSYPLRQIKGPQPQN